MKRIITACLFLFAAFTSAKSPNIHPDLLLAKTWQDNLDVSHYWVSEKLDGVRAYWDGEKLISRGGYVIHAPDWFTRNFPEQPLDGELWAGRGQFSHINSAIRRYPPDDAQWRQIGYYVFELPGADGTFTERIEQLKQLLERHPIPWLNKVQQFRVADNTALMQKLDRMTENGAEGLMLHHQDALYITGRQDALLKLKTWQDAEAVIVGYSKGKGKYKGMVGALIVETADKRRFRLGSGLTDKQRADPPAIGSTITYKYYGLTQNGLPRFASFMRVRRPASETGHN